MSWMVPVALMLAQATIGSLVQEGQKMHAEKRFDEAATVYQKALDIIPGDQLELLAALHDLRAEAFEGNRQYLQAVQEVQLALRYQKNNEDYKKHLAKLQLDASKNVASVDDIRQSMQRSRSFTVEADDNAQPGQNPAVVTPPVNFNFDQDTLTVTGERQVANLAMAMKAYPDSMFRLTGHTDVQGKAAYNMELSMRRAMRVKNELVRLGIGDAQISVVGMGSQRLIARGRTEDDHSRNRRVELVVVK